MSDQVSAEFAATEGEGDGSLEYWRESHRAYFTRECQNVGHVFDETLVKACEKFEVLYQDPGTGSSQKTD